MSERLIDIKQAILVGLFAASMLLTAQVQAHGGLALAEDMCVLTVGPYRMHFTGYQPLSQEEEFCEDIPEVGKTVIALDYIQNQSLSSQNYTLVFPDLPYTFSYYR